LNIVNTCGTPRADAEMEFFRTLDAQSSFHYHYARLIEILYCFEKIDELLHTPDILSERVRAYAQPNNNEGIGVAEAPRGTLIHHYRIDDNGLITYVNLIIATGHNSLAMDRGVFEVAKRYVHGAHLSEGMLNRVEAVIRAFDPCLSCSTHAVGQMPLHIQLLDPDGQILEEMTR
jgi:NAD-reducing hydrogenase large subunit